MDEKEKKVYDILLTPIMCDKRISKTLIQDGIIRSPQHYYSRSDEDMSDFSIGFYKIVYKDMLSDSNGEILNEKGYPINKEFMGDTMHSFNSLANIILEDKSKDSRSPIKKWPPKLVEYYSKYHCLVNFWVIPMRHGRNSAKLSKYDSLDYYLARVQGEFINDEEGYFGKFKSWKKFLKAHCMSSYVLKSNPLIMYYSADKDGCISELNRIHEFWKLRDEELVDEHTDELYEYFSKLGLVQNI